MADSKRKLILQYLRDTRLPIITVVGGYTTNVALVKRGLQPLDSLSDADLPALFVGKTVEKRDNITRNQYKAIITVFVVGYVKSPDGVSDAQGALDDMIADVTHALETDRTLGGNATWLEVKNVITDDGDLAPRAGFVMEVEIAYVTEGVTP